MITSPDNEKLKTIRKLQQKRWRAKLGLFSAEGEDLVGPNPVFLLRAGIDVDPDLLDSVSTLGSGTRVIGVYKQEWAEPAGELLVYLHAVEDPGNVGTIIRSAHALADATVVLGPGCADPYSPKAVRASMGSIFARPPASATLGALDGHKVALDVNAERDLRDLEVTAPVVLVLGSERGELPAGVAATGEPPEGASATGEPPEGASAEGASAEAADRVRIPVYADSLNVAMAATVALYEVALRMARDD